MANKKKQADVAIFTCKYARGIYTIGGDDVKFVDGKFQTSDPDLVARIKTHKAFGEEIACIQDLGNSEE